MTADPQPDIERLWADYKASGESTLRDQLIVHYSPLVKYVAGRVATGLPQNVDQAGLVSYGIFGLIDAIDKFDPERGFKFETYAIACAITLARAHAQSPLAAIVSGYVGSGKQLGEVLLEWAYDYAALSRDDFERFVAAQAG